MAEAVSFTVTTYRKLARGQTGPTRIGSVRLPLSAALDWILSELPDEAWDTEFPNEATHEGQPDACDVVQITIDWSKVPDSIRNPVLPARRR